MINIRTVYKVLMTFTIFIFAFVFQYFIEESSAMYLPLVYYMYTIPVLMFVLFRPIIKHDELLVYLFIISLFFQYFFNPVSFRLSTVLYTVLFVLTFLFYKKLLEKVNIPKEYYKKVLKIIMYSYAFVLFLQHVGYVIGIDGFNYSFNGTFKFNVLAQEASYIAQIIPITLYSYIKMRELDWKKRFELTDIAKDKLMWLMFAYITITCGSSSTILGFFLIIILLMKWEIKKMIPYLIGILILLPLSLSLLSNVASFKRIVDLIPAILNFDYIGVFNIDPSASARISPYMIYVSDFDLLNYNTWFGNGIDYSRTELTSKVVGYDSKDQGVGGIINFMLDYGLISFLLYLAMLRKYLFKKFKSPDFILWLILYSISAINVYIAWIYPIFIYTNNLICTKQFKKFSFNKNKIQYN